MIGRSNSMRASGGGSMPIFPVIFGKNVSAAPPGSAQGLYLIVSDINAAREELRGRGVDISEVFHDGGDVHTGEHEPYLFGRLRVSGSDPEHRSYRSFASFRDPDGNGWLLQEITTRLPGRVDPTTTTRRRSARSCAASRSARFFSNDLRIGKRSGRRTPARRVRARGT